LSAVLLSIALCAASVRADDVRALAPPGLPGTAQDLAFDEIMPSVDLEADNLVFLHKGKKHRGSSVGFHVAEPGRRKEATFAPAGSSNNLEAEVVSYRLARFLGVSDIYNPVTYYELGPKATARFKALLLKHPESYENRRENKSRTLAEIKSHPDKEFGIYRQRPEGKAYVAYGLGLEGQPNTSHPLFSGIRADRPQPSLTPMALTGVKGARSSFPKPTAPERDIARELSVLLTIDQLMGQWDRFWKNLEATGDVNGRLHLLARDNGGADVDDGWEWHATYLKILTRYDRSVMEQLIQLNAFLQGRTATLGAFTSVESWKTTLGFRKPQSFNTFKRKLALLVGQTLPNLEAKFGKNVYFATE
jgi:hypothetical protein